MTDLPNKIISSRDLARINHLMDALPTDSQSVLAPVGSALLGLTVGQQIEWPVPGGKTICLQVLDISYQSERFGEYTK
jgi:regulator of nucleoside diphosphate kinase